MQGVVEPADAREELKSCSFYSYDNGWFKELEVWDSAGRHFLVESISLEGNPGWLKRAWMRLINARCKIVYQSVKDLGVVTLEDLKSRLAEMARINREMIESAQPLDDFLAEIAAAQTFEDLCKLYR
jgi:hypothetical protein